LPGKANGKGADSLIWVFAQGRVGFGTPKLPSNICIKVHTTEASGGPAKKRGVRGHCARKHFFALIFFGSFLDQAKKEQNEVKVAEIG
jgi:hypothetical protein